MSFEEGSTVFADPLSRIVDDPRHSVGERRDVIVGRSDRGRVLVVMFTEREDALRIFSSRSATRAERRHYEEAHP